MLWLRSALCAIFLFGFMGTAFAQTEPSSQDVISQTKELAVIAGSLEKDAISLSDIQNKLTDQYEMAERLVKAFEGQEAELKDELDWIGEPVTGEDTSITRQRKSLTSELETVQQSLGQARRNLTEIASLENEISLLRREHRLDEIFERKTSILEPQRFVQAVNEGGAVASGLSKEAADWYAGAGEQRNLLLSWMLFGAVVVVATIAVVWSRGILRRLIDANLDKPLKERKAGAILGTLRLFGRLMPALIASFAVFQSVFLLNLASQSLEPMIRSLWLALMGVSAVNAGVNSFIGGNPVFPKKGDLEKLGTIWIRGGLTIAATIIAADFVLAQIISHAGGADALTSLRRASVAVLLAVILMALLNRRLWKLKDTSDPNAADSRISYAVNSGWLPIVRMIAGLLAIATIFATLLGYTPLAHDFMVRLCLVLAAGCLVFLIRDVLREFAHMTLGRLRSRTSGSGEEDLLVVWTDLLIDGLMFFGSLPVVLLLIGFDGFDLALFAKRLMGDFSIGNQQFSLIQLLLGIIAFVMLLGITRLIQRTADRRFFTRMRVDEGVRSSLKTLIGYVGLVIAFMTTVGMIGFDLSNLAIIAGALSVGIGFGLQSIVNNFVSGLILLFERPIKVGDWVVTSSGEGIVKKISVRSTEIETFDRSSIIVPNSELISNAVTNWTHKNRLGRVTVPVGVSYNEDPDRILEILKGIPKKVDIVLNYPEPLILFTGFGDSSLDFELRAYIADVSNSLGARTALRVAIFKAFREEGVEIPFPQRDLHLRGVEWTNTNTKQPEKESDN